MMPSATVRGPQETAQAAAAGRGASAALRCGQRRVGMVEGSVLGSRGLLEGGSVNF